MSNDQPPPSGWGDPESGRPPGNDPFKKPPAPPGGQGGEGSGQGSGPEQPPEGPPPGPPGGPPPGSPYGGGQGGPYGGQGGQGGPYGGGAGGTPPPYDPNAYGGGPYGGTPDPLAGMPPLADFGKRFAARVIDALIIFVPLFLISLLAGGWDNSANSGDSWDDIANQVNTGRQWLWSLVSLIAYVGYDTLMVKKHGQTIGKRLLNIRVAMLNDGSTPDTGASLMRAAVLWVPALVCCFCLWWIVIIITILTDKPYKQGLHDKAAKTVVVTVPQQ
ncbi:RDD family protein [Streptomyces sp. NPDC004609]|uniref:RDD family protein n=1 Tax=Streptomyces sp. NPDC004609 TaxID=3364704 RepID=UPI003699639E